MSVRQHTDAHGDAATIDALNPSGLAHQLYAAASRSALLTRPRRALSGMRSFAPTLVQPGPICKSSLLPAGSGGTDVHPRGDGCAERPRVQHRCSARGAHHRGALVSKRL